MSVKEDNEKLLEENAKLVKTNAGISETINASKLAVETAKKQEAEGRAILLELADEVEAMVATSEMALKGLTTVNSELEKVHTEKMKIELAIATTKAEAAEVYNKAKVEYETELEKILASIQVKRNELTEVLSKIKTESFNLVSIKSEIATLKEDLSTSQSHYDELSSKCDAKDGELDNLNKDYVAVSSALILAKQALKDTEISAEAYNDRKAGLTADIGSLQDEITSDKNTITGLFAEITELEAKKAEKEAEYKASESKIFELVRREEALGEREAYAKERFKVAGLEY